MDFKTIISPSYIARLTSALATLVPSSCVASFSEHALDGLEKRELKARVDRVRDALVLALKGRPRFGDKLEAVLKLPALANLGADTNASFELWPLTSFVAHQGIDDPKEALDGLQVLTRLFTSEFDVRPFLARHRTLTLARLAQWRSSPNHHDRRLVSEGTRAYLPWGTQVRWLRDEPQVILDLIAPLRDDPSDYVRRSVANNINDMTRRHPDWVVEQLAPWMHDASIERAALVRHALRSLIKKGHVSALELLGFSSHLDVVLDSFCATTHVHFGQTLELELTLTSTSPDSQSVVVDFAVHHIKASGTRTPKVFKWRTFELGARESLPLRKSHRIKPITTRRYIQGTHKVDVLLNGACMAEQEFELIM